MPLTHRIALLCLIAALSGLSSAAAQGTAISRRDGFLVLWQSIARPIQPNREPPFLDVPKGAQGWEEITFAKSRGLLDDEDPNFRPDEPLDSSSALLWLFRLRNLEPISDATPKANDIIGPEHVEALVERYRLELQQGNALTQEDLLATMRALDAALASEEHEVSLYSEKFHGKGTACGETFDMNALTAAHRSFPCNTLVRVTNAQNGSAVTVRITDRGPYVRGRDMDLSLAAFTSIADRSLGKIQARFERLGDVSRSTKCSDDRYRRRVGRGVILSPGIPWTFGLNRTLSLEANAYFAVERVVYPDGNAVDANDWIGPHETFTFTPSTLGEYVFHLRDTVGKKRAIAMTVVQCDTQQ